MSPRVELVYDGDCPNVSDTRAALLQAFTRAGVSAAWVEWERKAPDSPDYVREYGSPTLLVDGKDVAGTRPGEEVDCCRLYAGGENELRRVPPVNQIVAALTKGKDTQAPVDARPSAPFGWRRLLAVAPGLGASVLPVGTCPVCWPAYAGLLTTVGLGFLLDTTYLLPVTVVLLGLALGSLAYRANSRRGYGPLAVGIVGASIAVVGKFTLLSDSLLFFGLAFLVGASLWNAWPRRAAPSDSCAMCTLQESEAIQPSARKEIRP